LRDPALQHRFRIESGEIMCMQNTRALHGRTGFDGESDRLMYRIRANAGCLG
jgi:alpha-ketoglutarate-dependent taurine dioxygenase